MRKEFDNSAELLAYAGQQEMYAELLFQLEKDVNRAGISFSLKLEPEPVAGELADYLKELIYRLLLENFDQYLTLMYAMDIPERAFRNFTPSDAVEASEQITLKILQREWFKVWTRRHYKP
jgi:hypothetical protein